MTSDLPNQRNCSIKRLAFIQSHILRNCCCICNVCSENHYLFHFRLELCTKGCVHPVNVSLPTPPSSQALEKFTTSVLKGFTPRCKS